MDKIIIKGLKFLPITALILRKRAGSKFYFDIILHVNINKACHSDNVEDTVSYAKVVKTVRRVFAPKNTICSKNALKWLRMRFWKNIRRCLLQK